MDGARECFSLVDETHIFVDGCLPAQHISIDRVLEDMNVHLLGDEIRRFYLNEWVK
jgi:hypothetical protein